MQATKRPWHIRPGAKEHENIIIDSGDPHNHLTIAAVASVLNFAPFMSFTEGQIEQQAETEANAAFIIRACNEHDALILDRARLVAALRALVDAGVYADGEGIVYVGTSDEDAVIAARALLAEVGNG